jgi:hypothetical protein
MYSKTNPRAGQLSRRQKRVMLVVSLVVLCVLGGLGAWSAFAPDRYEGSANGCVNLTLPSSTGATNLHYCGAQAKAFCRSAFADSDQISLRARPQCVLAGLGPGTSPGSGSGSGSGSGPSASPASTRSLRKGMRGTAAGTRAIEVLGRQEGRESSAWPGGGGSAGAEARGRSQLEDYRDRAVVYQGDFHLRAEYAGFHAGA